MHVAFANNEKVNNLHWETSCFISFPIEEKKRCFIFHFWYVTLNETNFKIMKSVVHWETSRSKHKAIVNSSMTWNSINL